MRLDLNLTQDMLKEEILTEAHNITAIPLVIWFYLFSFLSMLVLGLFIFEYKNGKNKFLLVWFISFVLSSAFLTFLIFSPLLINDFTNWVLSWWQF